MGCVLIAENPPARPPARPLHPACPFRMGEAEIDAALYRPRPSGVPLGLWLEALSEDT